MEKKTGLIGHLISHISPFSYWVEKNWDLLSPYLQRSLLPVIQCLLEYQVEQPLPLLVLALLFFILDSITLYRKLTARHRRDVEEREKREEIILSERDKSDRFTEPD